MKTITICRLSLAPFALGLALAVAGCSQPPVEKPPQPPSGMVSASSVVLVPGTKLYGVDGKEKYTVVQVDEAHAFEGGNTERGLLVTAADKPGAQEWKKSSTLTLDTYTKP